ncbi:MAG: DNA polymerase III subunit epsilon [Holosporaceae bacterium]|jgi:DNA polymerase-3 subunit epsilon|nr:DNA polymerase III subunit epsilon [Holosporaceae bacterium]
MTIPKTVREIVLDTETTGLSPENGDRIVDIACVELINHVQTGNTYQVYINPQREMSEDATAISGITDEMLADKPLFHEIADDFLNFVGDSTLVIHNAKFDIAFLNSELSRVSRPLFNLDDVIDTLEISRRKFPGISGSLDFLCRKFEIDASARVTHGALIDCKLLAEVYINLLGGRQSGLSFAVEESPVIQKKHRRKHKAYEMRHFPPSEDEILAHRKFLEKINGPLWNA